VAARLSRTIIPFALIYVATNAQPTPTFELIGAKTAEPIDLSLTGVAGQAPDKPWRVMGMERADKPLTQFRLSAMEGGKAVEVRVARSYGGLVQDAAASWQKAIDKLTWQWRLDQALNGERKPDLKQREGDDVALRVCVLFDQVRPRLSLGARMQLALARTFTKGPLPTATICYAWAPDAKAGERLFNAFTARMQWVVAQADAASPQWREVSVNPMADYQKAFGHECDEPPRILGLAIVGDGDNTGAESMGYVRNIRLHVSPK
jgi:hypothetical protein